MKLIAQNSIFIAILFISGYMLDSYVITINRIQGPSMLPAFIDQSFAVSLNESMLKLFGQNYKAGDVYILNAQGSKLIKRLVALPGEQIRIQNGVIFVNDKNMTSYLQLMQPKESDTLSCKYFSKYEVPSNKYFFVGDNLCAALDSRQMGAVSEENILGKVIFNFSL
ncbi:MAG: signal peptidase I [Bdellovibrio sp.]|nr:signal peptidase I [Bdellovibrio sp.]